MPSGTTVKIFAPRIHKSNARLVLGQAEDQIDFATRKLTALVCATPSNAGVGVLDELIAEVDDQVEALLDASFQRIAAQNIIDYPEDCADELEVCAECGQSGFHKMSCGSKNENG
jgi:hypothetical protein